jgi:hypothetical protein
MLPFVVNRHWRTNGSIIPGTMLPNLTAQQFVAKWRKVDLSERSAVQQHVLDLCALVGRESPADADPAGQNFAFEMGAAKTGGGQSWTTHTGDWTSRCSRRTGGRRT